ncbi:hypothetical protein Trydic_g12755 [Trypoxylus dichotomus]
MNCGKIGSSRSGRVRIEFSLIILAAYVNRYTDSNCQFKNPALNLIKHINVSQEMDANTPKKCISLKAKNGYLRDVLNILDGGYDQLQAAEAVKIIICVCNACVDEVAQTRFKPNDVADLVVNCMRVIKKLDNNSMNSFLASIFHIVKYFINEADCTCIIHLQADLIRILKEKVQEFKCDGWKDLWMEVGTLVYNLSVGLHHINHKKSAFYSDYFIKKMIAFEGVKDTILKKDILHSALLNLTECYISQCDNSKAMLIAAFNIFLHPDNGKSAFCQWIRVKSSNREDDHLQNFNLVSIIDNNEAVVKSLYPQFSISVEDKINLLQFELKHYKMLWYSKTSVVGAFRELYLLCDTLTIVQLLVSIWSDGDNVIPIDMHDIIFEIIERFKKMLLDDSSNIKYRFYMAFLYFVQYNVAYRKTQQKNREDMQATHIEPDETQDLTDKNDECDVVTWYKALKIENHSAIMDYLKKSLSTFKKLIHNQNKNLLETMKVYVTLNKLANEYLLQSYTLEYIETWLCCLEVAKLLNDKICIIESIGYLLEKSDLNSPFIKEALTKASDLISQVGKDEMYREGENFIRKWIVLINFYISRGLAALNNGDATVSVKFYNKARDIYDKQEELKKYELLTIRFEFFEWKLQLLPCSFKFNGHSSALSKPHFLIDAVSVYYKENAHNSYVLYVLFQIFSSVVHMYRWLRQPREVRCYGREIIIIAQELIIPLKAIQLLSYLADADLLSVRIDDCCVKIDGICDILGHSKYKTTSTHPTGEKKLIQNELNAITDQFQEMMLDFPAAKRYQQATSGSPTLLKDSFEIPSFLEHENSCECFRCMSLDYQEFALVHIALQATLCYYEKNLEAAIEYFQGALCVYRKILSNEKCFQEKVKKVLGTSLFPSVECKFKEIYCIILLGLGNSVTNTEKLLTVNAELIGIIKRYPYSNIYLYNEALFQQLNYLSMKSEDPSRKSSHLSPIIDDDPPQGLLVTPESKCSQVSLTSTYTPVSISKKRIRKVIKFDLSEPEEKPNPTIKKPMAPILSHSTQTPAVSTSKIKVYRPTSVKSNRKKITEEKLDFTSEIKENLQIKFEHLERSREVEAKLKTRTKMLTEKLKKGSSNVPSIVVTDDSETGHCSNNGNERPRTRAKKNLMAELGCDENIPASASSKMNNNNKGAIKKRTHSRKMI